MSEELEEVKDKEEVKETPVKESVNYEDVARKKGWKPKDEYSGDAWVDAEEFVKREPLFERIKQQSSEVKELRKTIENMAGHFKKVQDVAVQKAIADLKAQKKEAIETGDVSRVEKIEEEIEAQKQIKEEPASVEIKPEIKEWVAKNPWFDTKPDMQKFAISFNKAYIADNPNATLSEALGETAEAVKARFPEAFKEKKAPTSKVEAPASADASPRKGYGRDRLKSDAQRQVYDQAKKHGIYSDMTEYVKQLEEMGELD